MHIYIHIMQQVDRLGDADGLQKYIVGELHTAAPSSVLMQFQEAQALRDICILI